jgi:hypothetical protein
MMMVHSESKRRTVFAPAKKKILEQGDRYRITIYRKILNFENLTVDGVGFREKKKSTISRREWTWKK